MLFFAHTRMENYMIEERQPEHVAGHVFLFRARKKETVDYVAHEQQHGRRFQDQLPHFAPTGSSRIGIDLIDQLKNNC